MSPIEDRTPIREISDDDHRFDLLADGELGESECRELLGGLDDEPGGWRRCALAFLEARSWKQDFGAIMQEADVRLAAERPARGSWLSRRGGTLLAMAASFLAALFLGWILQGMWRDPGSAGMAPVNMAGVRQQPEAPNPQPDRPPAVPQQAPGAAWPSQVPWRMVTNSGSFRLPAVERDRLDDQWLGSLPPAIPEDVLKALERTGHQVRHRRELFPFRMKDGRRLVVPVDRVDVHYVGRPAL